MSTDISAALAELQAKHVAAIKEIKGFSEREISAVKQSLANVQSEMRRPDPTDGRYEHKAFGNYETPGSRFVKEEKAIDLFRQTGRVRFPIGALWPETKTSILSSDLGSSTPGILNAQRVEAITPLAQRQLRIRDLLPQSRTTNNSVDFIKESAFTSAASPQTEGSAKGEAADTFTIDSERVTTIAHWLPMSVQVLDDLPELRKFIDNKLMYGVKLREETEIISGDDLGSHLRGLTLAASSYAGTYNSGSDTKADKLRHGILELAIRDEAVTGMVLNPVDYHTIELIKDDVNGANTGRYVIGDPLGGAMTVRTLWGVPVVQSNSIASGRFLMGNFQMAEIFDRQDATIDLSRDHDDYFIRNLVAVRCEERMTFIVRRPAAFTYGSY
jgi:HK97 family phage major capsid protein